jgi:hypothetical protein
MTNPTQMPKRASNVSEPVPPKCPHCGHELATVGLFSWMSPPWMILNIQCSNADCRCVLHMQIVPMVQQQQGEEPPPGPRIHIPS